MSGHSKWSSIKHKKGAIDAKRGKLFSKIIREIQVAARMGGGDINGNPRLRKAVAEAKGASMGGDTIKRAIQRGTGELDGTSYEEILYEGTGPGGALILVETMTDNKNRTVAEMRRIFEKHTGQLSTSGSAAWAFDRRGIITIARSATRAKSGRCSRTCRRSTPSYRRSRQPASR
jgi:YebC/PmpR family DNA-binding regulatory protein